MLNRSQNTGWLKIRSQNHSWSVEFSIVCCSYLPVRELSPAQQSLSNIGGTLCRFFHQSFLAGMGRRHHRGHCFCTVALVGQAWASFPSPIVRKHPENWAAFGEHLDQGPAPQGQSLLTWLGSRVGFFCHGRTKWMIKKKMPDTACINCDHYPGQSDLQACSVGVSSASKVLLRNVRVQTTGTLFKNWL